jgi:hypothetical protein
MNKLIFSLFIIILIGSCQKALKDVNDYFPKVKTVSATVQADGTVLVEGVIESEGASALQYVGFCCSTKKEPEMLDYQMMGDSLSAGMFSVVYDGNFQPDSVYYFRSWATNGFGYVYGNTLAVSKIIATPVTPPCTPPLNTYNIGSGGVINFTKISAVTQGFNYWEIKANDVDFRFGSVVTTGVFTTVSHNSPTSGQVQVAFKFGFDSFSLSAGSKVYVKRISAGIFEMSICNAPWVYNTRPNGTFYFNGRLKSPL